MNFYDQNFSIFFGNTKTSPFTIKEFRSLFQINKNELLTKIENKIPKSKDNCIFIHQTHSADGFVIDKSTKLQNLKDFSFSKDGDFLITNIPNLYIGVLTADCLPIIFYDIINNVIAIAHAGWQGSVKNIGPKVIETLKNTYKTQAKDIRVVFGPSAKSCCYEIDKEFLRNLNQNLMEQTIINRDNKLFFDLPKYNKILIENCGVISKNIDLENNNCTICNTQYCSYRRGKENSGLQITAVRLE